MDYLYLSDLYKDEKKYLGKTIKLKGWIKNHRKQKKFGFIYFSDGTAFRQLQLVYDNTLSNFEDIQKFHISSAIEVEGKLMFLILNFMVTAQRTILFSKRNILWNF